MIVTLDRDVSVADPRDALLVDLARLCAAVDAVARTLPAQVTPDAARDARRMVTRSLEALRSAQLAAHREGP